MLNLEKNIRASHHYRQDELIFCLSQNGEKLNALHAGPILEFKRRIKHVQKRHPTLVPQADLVFQI